MPTTPDKINGGAIQYGHYWLHLCIADALSSLISDQWPPQMRDIQIGNSNSITSISFPRATQIALASVVRRVFSQKHIGKTPFESRKINIFAKFLHRSSFWDSNLKDI